MLLFFYLNKHNLTQNVSVTNNYSVYSKPTKMYYDNNE